MRGSPEGAECPWVLGPLCSSLSLSLSEVRVAAVLDQGLAPVGVAVGPVRLRASGLDRLRGLAVVVMVLDHLLIVFGDGSELAADLRGTVTRAAMPLFAVLAGHLAYRSRLSRRWAVVAVCGVVLPVFVPWIDNPNILTLLALGALMLWLVHRLGGRLAPALLVLFVAVPLTVHANGFPVDWPGAFDPRAVWGLMALGALTSRELLASTGDRLPEVLARLGRFPLSVYVGHLLVLQLLVVSGA